MNSSDKTHTPRTTLSHHTTQAVYYGDDDLVRDLLGQASFVDVFMKQTFGRVPTAAERRIVDAVLVTLMEHGMTPSAIATRMIYSSSPENLQAAVAAGLLAVASRFVGTMEPAAELLDRIVGANAEGADEARTIARDFRSRREPVPGFGHHLHRPDDPRAIALLALAREVGTYGSRCCALERLAIEVDAASGRHITINATGAIAAILGDIGIPAALMRGFAVLSRAAGLIAHVAEEQREPSGRFIWSLVDGAMAAGHPTD
ncbi:citrate synthase family protein [Paraburkholderia xenovorans LB400]|uniref:citrate synthase (unknown stereospecificity) n=1 Tax=Paraburkholderia xenovorans (strain LB400) TaxID=266265 RepID=Q13GD0_PARXL|nr:citryl-CoA lyase [Paraburkholderia xenovorans]ABE36859.1 Putative citrate synthase [Paraburkholderia xenovorans LB400]AIP34499.1 citrate synthase family protein [Paraburkholderia xenovorans LB400]